MLSAKFEPASPELKQPQTYTLECAATGIGCKEFLLYANWYKVNKPLWYENGLKNRHTNIYFINATLINVYILYLQNFVQSLPCNAAG